MTLSTTRNYATANVIQVAPEDMGKVIGRKGRIANAIRTVVKAGALKENKKVAVDILEEVH